MIARIPERIHVHAHRRWSEQKPDIEPPSSTGRSDGVHPATVAAATAAAAAAAVAAGIGDPSARPAASSAVNSFMADLYKKRGEHARPSGGLPPDTDAPGGPRSTAQGPSHSCSCAFD